MKLILAEEELIDYLAEEYDLEIENARDAVIAAKVLGLINVNKSTEVNAETIYSDGRCW